MRRRTRFRVVSLLAVSAFGLSAADWQATASAGFGKYHYVSLDAPSATGDAGIGARYALDASIGRAIGEHLAIEGAWTFQDGDFEIRSGAQKTAFDAHAHSIHGDLYYYIRQRSVRVRPFAEFGAGVKLYQGIETVRPRPLAVLGSFAHQVDGRALLIFGGGVDYRLIGHWGLRFSVRDFATPFPSSVIVPASGVKVGGWLHDLVVAAGVQWRL
jgi:hypothetical protein